MLKKLRKNMKTVIIIVAFVFAAGMFAGLGFQGFRRLRSAPTGVAKVNGREIDKTRFNQNLSRLAASMPGIRRPQEMAYLQMMALSQVIDFQLMLNEAKRHVRVSGGEIDAAVKQIMETNKIPTKNDFEEAIKRNGLSVKQFRNMLKEDILIQKMVSKVKGEVQLNPEDLREIRASHILIMPESKSATEEGKLKLSPDHEAKKLAEALLGRIRAGEDFAKLAKEYSDDPGSSGNGGDLGFFSTGSMVPEFEDAAFALKPGEVSGVIKSPYGYHIIKLIDTRLRELPEDAKDKDLKEYVLAEKKEKAFSKWMYDAKKDATIEIINPILKAYDYRMKGKPDLAIAEYNKALANNPQDAYIHLLIGDTYEQKGEADLAIAEYTKATTLNSSDPTVFIVLGDAYERAGKRDKALEQYKKASVLAGEVRELHEELAEIFKNLKAWNLEKAEREKITQIEKKKEFEESIRKQSEENIELE